MKQTSKKNTVWILLTAAGVAGAAGLVGCGSNDGGDLDGTTGGGGQSGDPSDPSTSPTESTLPTVGESCVAGCGAGQRCESGVCVCAPDYTLCGDTCVDISNSGDNCGECGAGCEDGSVCLSGSCETSCPSGLEECGGGCVNLEASAVHCGQCDNACVGGSSCNAGDCECPAGGELCNDLCTDTGSDAAHCGGCGVECDSDQFCSQGGCVDKCPSGETECGSSCVDTSSSLLHCGGCGDPCGSDEICNGGSCECTTGFDTCDGDAVCDSLASDQNCGTCGNACDATGEYCDGSSCTCGAGSEVCDGACVESATAFLRDVDHCGACNNVCSPGEICRGSDCVSPVACSFEPDASDSNGEAGETVGITEEHNYWRWRVGESPLQWDTGLAADAQEYADTCPEVHDSTRDNSSFSNVGENLYWSWSGRSDYEADPVNAVTSWADEREDWDYGWALGDQGSAVVGHYTQIVWKNTTHVGCGVKHGCANLFGKPGDPDTTGTTVVCRYGEAGNWGGVEPYTYIDHDITTWDSANACLDQDNDDVERQYDIDDTDRRVD